MDRDRKEYGHQQQLVAQIALKLDRSEDPPVWVVEYLHRDTGPHLIRQWPIQRGRLSASQVSDMTSWIGAQVAGDLWTWGGGQAAWQASWLPEELLGDTPMT